MTVAATRLFSDGYRPSPGEEQSFFGAIRLANGVYKTTERRRMDDLNGLILAAVRRRDRPPREILDVAVSSGVSAVEWLQSLREAGFDPQLTATDLSLKARLLRLSAAHSALVDSRGRLLQHSLFGLAVKPYVGRRREYFTGEALLSALGNRLFEAANPDDAPAREVLLLSAEARAAAAAFREADIFAYEDAFSARFDLVRAANILNLGYFEPDQIRLALAHLKRYCAGPGALLVLNRTAADRSNHASLLRLGDDRRFVVEDRLGRGSEVEDLALEL